MIERVSFSEFCDEFQDINRNNNFSYEAKRLMYDWLESYDENYELDGIALCCDFSEMEAEEILEYYDIQVEEDATDEEIQEAVEAYLGYHTLLIGKTKNETYLFQNF